MSFADYRGILSGQSWVTAPGLKTSAKPAFITYSFPRTMTAGDREVFSESIESWQPFSGRDIADARAALKQWGDASGIRFLETRADHGDIQFSWIPSFSSAFAYYPLQDAPYGARPNYFTSYLDIAGNVYLNTSYEDYFRNDPAFKTYTLLHEIGHAIGLKHPFDTSSYNGTLLASDLDNVRSTVMAYSGDDEASPTTLGPLDRAAVQNLYGSGASDGKHLANWRWNADSEILYQTGKSGSDALIGTSVRDVLKGSGGNDRLHGFTGNDILNGGAGRDVLLGGPGRDVFRFDTKPIASRYADSIYDFSVPDDRVQLSRAVFSKLGPKGYLNENAFETGTYATSPTTRIIYDKDNNGALYYDADGSGALGRMKIATLSSGLDMMASHFLII